MPYSWLDDSVFEVISIGDPDMLVQAFNGCAAIFDSSGMQMTVRAAFYLSAIIFGFKYLLTQRFELTSVLASLIVYMLMFGPKVTVLVKDGYTGAVSAPIAHVPIGSAGAYSLVSQVGYFFAKTFEDNFSVIVSGSEYTAKGYLDALQVLLAMRDLSLTNASSDGVNAGNLDRSISNYMVNCVYYDLEMGTAAASLNPQQIYKDASVWSKLKTHYVNIFLKVFTPTSGPDGEVLNCPAAYDRINAIFFTDTNWKDQIWDSYLKRAIGTKFDSAGTAIDRVGGALEAVNLSSADAMNFTINSVLYRALRDGSTAYAASQPARIGSAITLTQAENQRNITWTAERTMFERYAKPITSFIEVFMIAATPIMAIAIAAFGAAGISTLGKFLMMHVWVSLWVPTLAIANMYSYTVINKYMAGLAASLGNADPMSIQGMDNWVMEIQRQFATGSMIAASTPMLTLFLLYGSSQVASMLAQKMSSAEHVDAKVAAPNMVNPGSVATTTGFTSSPLMRGIGSAQGVAVESRTTAALSTNQVTTAKSAMDASAESFNRNFGVGGSQNQGVKVGIGSTGAHTFTGANGVNNLESTSLQAATQATAGVTNNAQVAAKLSAVGSSILQHATNGSIAIKTPEGLPIPVGANLSVSRGTIDAEQISKDTGATVAEVKQFAKNLSQIATGNTQVGADYRQQAQSAKTDQVGFDYTRDVANSHTEQIGKGLGQTLTTAKTFMEATTQTKSASSTVTQDAGQYWNAFTQTNGTYNAENNVGATWGRAYGTDQAASEKRQTRLDYEMKNPAVQAAIGNVSPYERELATKAWIMATDSNAGVAHELNYRTPESKNSLPLQTITSAVSGQEDAKKLETSVNQSVNPQDSSTVRELAEEKTKPVLASTTAKIAQLAPVAAAVVASASTPETPSTYQANVQGVRSVNGGFTSTVDATATQSRNDMVQDADALMPGPSIAGTLSPLPAQADSTKPFSASSSPSAPTGASSPTPAAAPSVSANSAPRSTGGAPVTAAASSNESTPTAPQSPAPATDGSAPTSPASKATGAPATTETSGATNQSQRAPAPVLTMKNAPPANGAAKNKDIFDHLFDAPSPSVTVGSLQVAPPTSGVPVASVPTTADSSAPLPVATLPATSVPAPAQVASVRTAPAPVAARANLSPGAAVPVAATRQPSASDVKPVPASQGSSLLTPGVDSTRLLASLRFNTLDNAALLRTRINFSNGTMLGPDGKPMTTQAVAENPEYFSKKHAEMKAAEAAASLKALSIDQWAGREAEQRIGKK